MITSQITFIYYDDFQYGKQWVEETLKLPLEMDQGFARIYKVNEAAYLGIVDATKGSIPQQGKHQALISFNVDDVQSYYKRLKAMIPLKTDIITHDKIPLISFFFDDEEGHHFEIQQFIKAPYNTIF